MTVLSRSAVNPRMMTIQCDLCCPPPIATNDEELLLSSGWQLAGHGAALDACPECHREGRVGRLAPRRERYPRGTDGDRLPELMLIGAAKCGTTSLHAYLDTHPDIAMAELKELRFFSDPDCGDWLGWYQQQFTPDAAVVGESSTMYTRSPALPGVAERMAATIPDARLVYMVRDPVERAVSSYLEERFQLFEPRTIEAAFADLDDPYNPYVSASRYAEQLDHFLAHYPREQVLVLPLSELESQPDATMERVFTFAGVDSTHVVDTGQRLNEGGTKYEYVGIGARLRHSVAGRVVRRLPDRHRERITSMARRAMSRPLERPELPADLRRRLEEALAPDAARFRELTGLAVEDWSV